MKSMLSRLYALFFPYIPKCVCCGVERGVDDGYVCAACAQKLEQLKAGKTHAQGYEAYAVYNYDGVAKSIVKKYKYRDGKWLSAFMAAKMVQAVEREFDDIGCICHVPLHKKRRRLRGFDQAEALACRIAEAADIPYAGVLKRVKNTKTQARLSAAARQENIKGAFEPAAPVHGCVLLVDDVLTTGATAVECADVLCRAGARNVYVLTFAKSVYEDRR